ncbi:MAG TPA: UDP-3-O-acyl-N-acetylglucosamine deacetylase [Trueperaceae bacterium]|nr:UDP-3-O-acyl-N-acetylglucosamine deacetylase [Trueperaceae bacterium]
MTRGRDGSVTLSGPTIHTGDTATATLKRSDGPIAFVRDGTRIPATVANVVATDRTTTLGADARTVSLVEHLLAALRIAGFYAGVTITVSGSELPILDGSAQPWLDALAALGEPPEAPEALRVTDVVEVKVGDSVARVEPGPESLRCTVAFPHPAIGTQVWSGGPESYADLAAARTFGFMAEAEVLRSRGLALGAVLEHAIVFADDGPMSPLRFADEPVRHKALDAVGDLALLGRPVAASITIERGSHKLHHALMLALTSTSTRPATVQEP